MPNLHTINSDSAGLASQIRANRHRRMGKIPTIFATLAHSPVAQGLLAFGGALSTGALSKQLRKQLSKQLSKQLRKQVALTLAGEKTYDNCASTQTVMAIGAGLDKAAATQSRCDQASHPQTQAILSFSKELVLQRKQISSGEISKLRDAGVNDTESVEIISSMGINRFTNYFNHVAQTEIDFPMVTTQSSN